MVKGALYGLEVFCFWVFQKSDGEGTKKREMPVTSLSRYPISGAHVAPQRYTIFCDG